ncbi:Ppx/GppA family phosphatase [Clostridium sp. SHJSY1]|uniref:Ppx/GppA phosphatase family protein n=1 Tax=Clostridium sp. SHJSY1 TaxID=2942483 RepID=UPI002876139F|nr:Ppx/GppA phosphatase family protein [Clostridium sp. SHJSY1]MDS0524740.1 Ppx/GppA family phosphatase [Clostridium sp. SHJSY1]
MDKTGVIIIGGNSITFTLTEIQKSGYFKIIDELSFPIRLYDDIMKNYEISDLKLKETISILKEFRNLADTYEVTKLIPVSTSFLNDAINKDIFIKTIKKELNIELCILETKDEIYYTYLSIINSIYLDNAILINIQEKTTHIIWITNKTIKHSVTLSIGSTNLSYNYNLQDKILKENIDKALINIKSELNKISKIKGIKFDHIIGTGETIHSVAKLDRIRKKYPLDILHNYITNDIDIQDIYNLLKSKTLTQRKRLDGISQENVDLLVGGTLLFQEIVSYFNISNITISKPSLKEGIIFDYIEKNFNLTQDILDLSLIGLVEDFNLNLSHSKHVYHTTKKLFESLKPLHKLGDYYNKIIKTASYLHDIGTNINYYQHEKHSFYIILNSNINGLTHKELLLSSAIAASHRNFSYHLSLPQYCLLINKLNVKAIDEIGILLAIAEKLNRNLKSEAEDLHVTITENSVIIKILSKSDLNLEFQQISKLSRRFHEIYDKTLLIFKD